MGAPVITGVPPEVWTQILEVLQELGLTVVDLVQMGITTYEGAGGLKEYLLNNGWELKEVWDLKQMWFYTGPGNATETNALVQYVANEVTIAGTAGAQYVSHFTYGGSTMGKLKKGIVFGSILALLISSLDPTMITDALKGRLNATLDRFADENDDIPVIVNEDGKTYYHEDMINALRQVLIDEGVYDTGGIIFPTYDEQARVTFGNSTAVYTASELNNGQICQSVVMVSNNQPHELLKVQLVLNGNVVKEFNADELLYCLEGSSSSSQVCICTILDEPITYSSLRAVYADTTDTVGTTAHTTPAVRVEYKGNVYTGYAIDTMVASFGPMSTNATITANGYNTFVATDIKKGFVYDATKQGGGGGVEGITVASDLINKGIGNIATSLDDIFDNYATDYVTTINPSDEDLSAKDKWFPISSNNNDVWTHGVTDTDSSKAPEGDVDPDLETDLADAIKNIIDDYYRDPTDPDSPPTYPEIPVGDSGDTPPDNPPLTPGINANGSNGLWSIYNPTIGEVHDFGAWLWSDSLADQFKRIFNSPIDGIIGFHLLYATPSTGASKYIQCGFLTSPVSSATVTDQYTEIDCGTVSIGEYYRNALDYDNTRISIYLPFVGIVPLDSNVVMGSTLNVTYRIDVLTGTCLAQIKVMKENSDAVMYAFDGNCAVQIPLTATTYTGMVGALLSGISAGASVMTGNLIQAVNSGFSAIARGYSGLTGVKQSGTFGANAGALGIRKPYVIITHPVSAMPAGFNSIEGIPSNVSVTLGALSGFTRVRSVHLENIGNATDEEITMIKDLLTEGVII